MGWREMREKRRKRLLADQKERAELRALSTEHIVAEAIHRHFQGIWDRVEGYREDSRSGWMRIENRVTVLERDMAALLRRLEQAENKGA